MTLVTNLTYCQTLNFAGYLVLDRKCSDDIANVLLDCIDSHVDQNLFATNESQLTDCDVEGLSNQSAMKSICLSINDILHTCAHPPDCILTIILNLFLKLGMSSAISALVSLI
jgi:ribosomal RNA-processing protein 12